MGRRLSAGPNQKIMNHRLGLWNETLRSSSLGGLAATLLQGCVRLLSAAHWPPTRRHPTPLLTYSKAMGVGFARFAVFLSLFLWVRFAPAQGAGSISGKVEDATGAPIRGASVTVKDLETGATRTAATDDKGAYRVLALAVGQHEVKAEKSGFRAALRTGINLAVGQEAVVNLSLDVGEIAQQVTVTG